MRRMTAALCVLMLALSASGGCGPGTRDVSRDPAFRGDYELDGVYVLVRNYGDLTTGTKIEVDRFIYRAVFYGGPSVYAKVLDGPLAGQDVEIGGMCTWIEKENYPIPYVNGTYLERYSRAEVLSPKVYSTNSGAATAPAAVPFDTYSGYFVANKFAPDKAESFVVIKDQKSFDDIFGAAFVMNDKSHRLPPNVFDSKIVIAAIKRGKAVWQFKVKEVVLDGATLTIRYATTAEKSDSAEYACPLIISVPTADYGVVIFEEDGKIVKKLENK